MADQKHKILTKTLYVNGLGCPKSLWLAINDPDRLPAVNESARFTMHQGRLVGELARKRYPKGVLLPAEGTEENDKRSHGLLEKRVPLFEAGFFDPSGACYARADVLLPVGKDAWDILEVKSATSVSPEHVHDVAFQRFCYTGAGLKIRKSGLLLVNSEYVLSGELDPSQLLNEVDVSDAVLKVEPTVPGNVERLLGVARSKKCPEFGQGEPFHKDEAGVHEEDSIWREHPGSDILDLYRGGKHAIALLESGVYRIEDIPKSVVLKGKQVIQHAAHSSGKVQIDRTRIVAFLERLRYPLHFLDFETTFGTAIPIFDGTRPYQQIPFQFSVHVVDSPDEEPHHHWFLSVEPKDPRKTLMDALRKAIGPKGHLVAYNQSFEKSRLEELAAFLPEHADWVADVNGRFVDLIVPFREFAYYNPAQEGSASLKAVLPAVTGHGYEGLEISNGGQASLAYLYTAFGTPEGKRALPQEVEATRRALERYCAQDTEGMVRIVQKLTEIAVSAD